MTDANERARAIALRKAAIEFAQCLHQPVADDDDRAGAAANRKLLKAALAYAGAALAAERALALVERELCTRDCVCEMEGCFGCETCARIAAALAAEREKGWDWGREAAIAEVIDGWPAHQGEEGPEPIVRAIRALVGAGGGGK